MREAMRLYHPTLVQGYDLVVIARNTFEEATTFDAVRRQMGELLRRAALQHEARPCDDSSSG